MADPLTPEDLASLATERGPVNMAVGGLLVFEGGPGVTYAAVVEQLRQRLHLIPRYRQRLEEAPLGLTTPLWVDDDAFDVEWHVVAAKLPAPGDDDELAAYVGRAMSRKLDRSRPLWELHVIDGLADGRAALLAKMHHALVDGLAAVDVGTVILDPTPERMEIPEASPWEPRPYERRRHLARLAATPVIRGQRLLSGTLTRALDVSPRRAVDDLRGAAELVAELTRQRPAAPDTSLNADIGPNRRYATVRGRLDEIKAVGRASGGTVNDVLLATVAGMLERILPPLRSAPVVLVPVSVRAEGDKGQMGNKISTVFVDLPVDEPNPLRRVHAISETTAELKDSAAVRAGALIAGASGWVPPAVSSVLVRAMGGVRAMNLVVSNVPGPQQPFYLNGSRLLEAYPAVPLNPSHQGLTVGILSYDGGVFFGLLADRDLDPPVTEAAAALEEALDELVSAT